MCVILFGKDIDLYEYSRDCLPMICRFFSELVFVWVVKKDPRKVRAMTQNYSMSCFLAAGREFAQNLQNRLSLEESFFQETTNFQQDSASPRRDFQRNHRLDSYHSLKSTINNRKFPREISFVTYTQRYCLRYRLSCLQINKHHRDNRKFQSTSPLFMIAGPRSGEISSKDSSGIGSNIWLFDAS